MVRVPRLGRLRIPRLTRGLRARLRAQQAWWRRRLRARAAAAGQEVLFPAAGGGAIAVDTLAGDPGAGGAAPRIVILHATAGSGHKRAAQAIAAGITAQRPDALVREVDTLVFASQLYRSTYATSYNAMAARAPALWSVLYHSSKMGAVNRGTAPVRLAVDRLNLRRLVRVVEREQPDAVVCTHFLPVEALSPMRERGRLPVPLHCVITDFAAHPFWAFPHVDRYYVASDTVRDELAALGVPAERIEVSGIPVDPAFARTIGRDAARRRFGLAPDDKVVLVMGGGSGVGPIGDVAQRLAALNERPRIVALCGMNARLRAAIASLEAAAEGRILTLGFTPEVDVLLEAADVVVSKAGGLTCSEALIKRTPLVVFRPTPGQEVANAKYLEAGGAAVLAESAEDVAAVVGTWLSNPAKRERVAAAAAALARPDAAAAIARRVLDSLPAERRRTA